MSKETISRPFRRPFLMTGALAIALLAGACSGRYETNVAGHKSGVYYSTPGVNVKVRPGYRRVWRRGYYTRGGYWRPGRWHWVRR